MMQNLQNNQQFQQQGPQQQFQPQMQMPHLQPPMPDQQRQQMPQYQNQGQGQNMKQYDIFQEMSEIRKQNEEIMKFNRENQRNTKLNNLYRDIKDSLEFNKDKYPVTYTAQNDSLIQQLAQQVLLAENQYGRPFPVEQALQSYEGLLEQHGKTYANVHGVNVRREDNVVYDEKTNQQIANPKDDDPIVLEKKQQQEQQQQKQEEPTIKDSGSAPSKIAEKMPKHVAGNASGEEVLMDSLKSVGLYPMS